MKKTFIMLCCGAGISSGMLATRTRNAAKDQGIAVTVEARSESEVADYFSVIDILFLGPHYASQQKEFQKLADRYHIPVMVVPQEIYGRLDGKALLELAINTLKN
ncbi:PTS sugar transporter subunit IIB [Xenorhabdus doucetiae]|uniref:PTS system cellobiose-specific IIB component n=1 Tax=Xenorhabdus doucetiae TaxID=351671 RepID=A0A068QRP2_9GAMM|nr:MULTISPECIES: PTS sugar transporter subunit IIB [Xenorhabdus]MBD2784045.1 PTS sugar transporter subunit IIB [Xenorhabdus sp. 3]MBD2787830.1 PTS sugar transporter subunit IIB [Xenorhabdus sp. DI]MBD2795334.1 PTS sugar transporter subunit IIB [Xenorhabdus sp. 18]TYP16583.1 PTS system cellobiose-specific IIB component [Xenorhabdus doucetiae]CDG16510.1 PTS system protein [Xenorhabdus doucetiae]